MNRLEPIYHIAQYINILLYIYIYDLADLPICQISKFRVPYWLKTDIFPPFSEMKIAA